MSFQITGLSAAYFKPLYAMTDAELAARGIDRVVADAPDSAPCRVSLQDATPGERLLLLNYEHQPAVTPYRSAHAIFVREGSETAALAVGETPDVLRIRTLSVRAFDATGAMLDADLTEGLELEPLIARLFDDPGAAYLHVHYARRGCYAARVDRA